MSPEPRASTQRRDQTVHALGLAYRDGLLSTGTLELRLDAALRSTTLAQLRELVADLSGSGRLRDRLGNLLSRAERTPTVQAAAVNLILPRAADGPRLTVGRDPSCDIVFTEATVSRFHALVHREADRWVLHDLGSLNGTHVNGQRVISCEVCPGDEAELGTLTTRLV